MASTNASLKILTLEVFFFDCIHSHALIQLSDISILIKQSFQVCTFLFVSGSAIYVRIYSSHNIVVLFVHVLLPEPPGTNVNVRIVVQC